jgi:hypothetical protein
LAEKHESLAERVEYEKYELAEAHAAEVTKLHTDSDLETQSDIEYYQIVCHQLHDLHEALALSFEEVKAQCLFFPNKGTKVEEMIDWVVGEVKVVPDTVWRLNDNFAILGIEGVLSMLNGKGCQELGRLHDLAGSSDALVLEEVLEDVHKLAERIMRRWWKRHGLLEALRRLEEAHAKTISDSSYKELFFC